MTTRFQIVMAAVALMLSFANLLAENKPCDALSVTEYARYDGPLGDRWAVLVVPAKTSRDCALDLIRKLHQAEPRVHFEVFDSADELEHYVRWAKASGREQDSLFYPEKWIDKHNLASLYLFTRGPLHECQWTVKFRKGDDVELDRVDCRSDIPR